MRSVNQRGHVLEHASHAFGLGPQPVGCPLAPSQELLGQLPDVGPVLKGDAHHLRDHQHGQGRGKVSPSHPCALFPPPRPGDL